MMRAVRVSAFGGPEVLKVQSIAIPKVQDNQVLIQVQAVGVNPLDVAIRSGTHGLKPELPYTPGRDVAGIVKAIGNGVKNVQVGQRVYSNGASGGYAEYCCANGNRVFALSDRLTFEQGASLGAPYYTAYRSLFLKAQGKPGETVLIHGASGGVGIAAVQLAKAHGMTVLATVGTKEGADLVTSCGADRVFNHRDNDYVNKIVETTEGRGLNVILEMLANENLVTDLSRLAAVQGRIIVIGSRGSIPEFAPRLVMGKELSIIGCAFLNATESEWATMNAAISAGIDVGYIKPIVAKVYPFEDVAKSHHDLMSSSGAKGKLILKL